MWSTGIGDPVLWGTVAFILNYVPIIGPAAAILIFLFAGSLTITSTWQALLPAALYGAIHVIEGETVTPMLLARRFTLNPVLVVFSFVFWFWLWGVPGAILSAPILATTKIVCDRIRPLAALGHISELRARTLPLFEARSTAIMLNPPPRAPTWPARAAT